MSEQKVVDCILNAYKTSGMAQPGSGLRAKITRATNNARAGKFPKKVYTVDQILKNPSHCIDGHVEGVTFFTDRVDHTKSKLYVASYLLGKKEISPSLASARRRVGQSNEEFKLRTATSRVGRQPAARTSLQESQHAARSRIQAAFREGHRTKVSPTAREGQTIGQPQNGATHASTRVDPVHLTPTTTVQQLFDRVDWEEDRRVSADPFRQTGGVRRNGSTRRRS